MARRSQGHSSICARMSFPCRDNLNPGWQISSPERFFTQSHEDKKGSWMKETRKKPREALLPVPEIDFSEVLGVLVELGRAGNLNASTHLRFHASTSS